MEMDMQRNASNTQGKAVKACLILVAFVVAVMADRAMSEESLSSALRRAKYLLSGKMTTDEDFSAYTNSSDDYRRAVRGLIDADTFYDASLRYHERIFGVGLPLDYLDELKRAEIDGKNGKFAKLRCSKDKSDRFHCSWASKDTGKTKSAECPDSYLQPVGVFWYPSLTAWVCPSVSRTCGSDLSRCFIEYEDEDIAKNSELGASEIYDSRFTTIKSLSRQSAGMAAAVVTENYPYTLLLQPGLSAVDGAIANFYAQTYHFKIEGLHIPEMVTSLLENFRFTNTRYKLVYTGPSYESAGIMTTFGWLRRYEKNRTRANQMYERLLCRKFTSELPKVFPADPGNLRETDGCKGCHATLDPLADFYKAWGEGGELYNGDKGTIDTTFAGQGGRYVSDLANIIRNDKAFATCTVQNVWKWMMGRSFYHAESDLRSKLTSYFITTKYSFKELVYAVATHPAFLEGKRGDALVTDPLEDPPLGEVPTTTTRPCDTKIVYATDIAPKLSLCTSCHGASSSPRQDLSSESQWKKFGKTAAGMMASGSMPPGLNGPPTIGPTFELKEAVRCWLEQNP